MNLIFDVDDTLYDQIQPFKKAFEKQFSHLKTIDIHELYVKSRKYSDDVFYLQQSGVITVEQSGVYRIKKAMEDYQVKLSEEEALQFQREYAAQQSKIILDEDIVSLLEYARNQHIPMGIITNGPKDHQQKKIDALQLTKWIKEQNIVISGAVGIDKPDIRIFEYCEKVMNLIKEDTIFIGDSYASDICGAKAAGWKTIWLNRRKHKLKKEALYHPDWIVYDGKELFDLMMKIMKGSR